MASFRCNDIDGFVLDMESMARLDGGAVDSILSAGAEVVKKAHAAEIGRRFDRHTAKLIGSPAVYLKLGRNGERYALIYPKGEHHRYRPKSGGDGVARNADLGFVHEFGGHGNAATGWMRDANDGCAGATAEAEEKAYDAWLKTHNL